MCVQYVVNKIRYGPASRATNNKCPPSSFILHALTQCALLLSNKLLAVFQTLHNQLLALRTSVDIPYILRHGLEV